MYNLHPIDPKPVRMPSYRIQTSGIFNGREVGRQSSLITTVNGPKPVNRLTSRFPDIKSTRCPKAARRRLFSAPKQSDAHVEAFRQWQRQRKLEAILEEMGPIAQESEPVHIPEPEIEMKRVFVKDIVQHVCEVFDVPKSDVLSTRRFRTCVRPRQVVMHLARIYTTLSLPQIGRLIGGKDHSTVLHGQRKIEELLSAGDPELEAKIRQVEVRL